jgi:small subunit ribosomal protein S16
MVRIRLRRQGAKKQPTYRIVVTDQRAPRDGGILENVGYFNPRTEPETVSVDVERVRYWLGVGAQPSQAVERLLKAAGAYATPAVSAAA